VTVINPGKPVAVLPNGFTYDPVTPTLRVDFVLAFGDSITYGTSTDWCDVDGTPVICGTTIVGYPERLRGLLQARYPSQFFQVQNEGVPGECASRPCGPQTSGQGRLPTSLNAAQDVVVILQGVNDLNAGVSVPDIISALTSMISSARNAGKLVVISTLTPVKPREDNGLFKAVPARIAELNAAIESMKASLGVPRVDMTAAFGAGYAALLSPDGLHPNAAGYQRMAEAIRDKLVEQFEITPSSGRAPTPARGLSTSQSKTRPALRAVASE
jgi:lysophospholipase L1-like esterase